MNQVTWEQYAGWQRYFELDPFAEERADLRAAQICWMLAEINRDRKRHPRPYKLEDFVLKFESTRRVRKSEEVKRITTQEEWNAFRSMLRSA